MPDPLQASMLSLGLPGTDLRVSPICLGTAGFGILTDQEASFALLDGYHEAGGNFLDTARIYGYKGPDEAPLSETIIGRWLARSGVRTGIVLATKGGHYDLEDPERRPRISPRHLWHDLDASREALQTSVVDLYWLHRDDPTVPVSEVLGILNEMVDNGAIRFFGCSNWSASRIDEAITVGSRTGTRTFVANQLLWNLAVPNPGSLDNRHTVRMDDEMKMMHARHGIAAVAYSSQASGYFVMADAGMGEASLPDWMRGRYGGRRNLARLERARRLAARHARSVNEIVLSYLVSQPIPTIPIIGSTNAVELRESLQAHDLRLAADELDYLERDADSDVIT